MRLTVCTSSHAASTTHCCSGPRIHAIASHLCLRDLACEASVASRCSLSLKSCLGAFTVCAAVRLITGITALAGTARKPGGNVIFASAFSCASSAAISRCLAGVIARLFCSGTNATSCGHRAISTDPAISAHPTVPSSAPAAAVLSLRLRHRIPCTRCTSSDRLCHAPSDNGFSSTLQSPLRQARKACCIGPRRIRNCAPRPHRTPFPAPGTARCSIHDQRRDSAERPPAPASAQGSSSHRRRRKMLSLVQNNLLKLGLPSTAPSATPESESAAPEIQSRSAGPASPSCKSSTRPPRTSFSAAASVALNSTGWAAFHNFRSRIECSRQICRSAKRGRTSPEPPQSPDPSAIQLQQRRCRTPRSRHAWHCAARTEMYKRRSTATLAATTNPAAQHHEPMRRRNSWHHL